MSWETVFPSRETADNTLWISVPQCVPLLLSSGTPAHQSTGDSILTAWIHPDRLLRQGRRISRVERSGAGLAVILERRDVLELSV